MSVTHQKWIAGDLVLDCREQSVSLAGEAQQLTQQLFTLLETLMSRSGELVTKAELISTVWQDRAVSDAVLTTAIRELRQKLGDNARAPDFIETVHGRGYRFLKSVSSPVDQDESQEKVGARLSTPQHLPQREPGRSSLLRIILPGGVALVTALGIALINQAYVPKAQEPGMTLESIQPPDLGTSLSVAVLPFDLGALEEKEAWLAEGLARGVLNSLSQSDRLLVSSEQASFRLAEEGLAPAEIAKHLGVGHIVTGAFSAEQEDELNVTLHLLRAADGEEIWRRAFELGGEAPDLFLSQTEISAALHEVLLQADEDIVIDMPQAERGIDREAFRLKERAQSLIKKRDQNSLRNAQGMLEEAILLDPEFGEAYALLGEVSLLMGTFDGADSHDIMREAQAKIEKALTLSPKNARVLTTASFLAIAKQDIELALRYSDEAIALDPNNAVALQRRGVVLILQSRPRDAAQSLREATLRDPLTPVLLSNLSGVELALGNAGAALEIAQDNISWNRGDFIANGTLGDVYRQMGHYENAHRYFLASQSLRTGAGLGQWNQGLLYWRVGLPDHVISNIGEDAWAPRALAFQALNKINEAEKLADLHQDYRLATTSSIIIYRWIGRDEKALQLLDGILDHWKLLDGRPYEERNRVQAINALSLLIKLGDDNRAQIVNESMKGYFEGRAPGEITLASDLYVAAAWGVLNDDTPMAMTYIDESLERGHIMRELLADPIFGALRENPDFASRLERLENNALRTRSALREQLEYFHQEIR